MAQVALAAALSNRPVIPIVRARKVFQLQDDIASFDLALFRRTFEVSRRSKVGLNSGSRTVFKTQRWFVHLGMAGAATRVAVNRSNPTASKT